MGAGISGSASASEIDDGRNWPLKPRLEDIPESCVALVLMRLDPSEICNLAKLNRAFRGASSADFVWESKLPENYRYVIEKVFADFPANLTKKDIFATLSRHNLFDEGTKEIWIDKVKGGLCSSISSKALTITGIDDRRYWNHIPCDESSFETIAYLHQIWWFEVNGDIDFQFPQGTYSLFFKLYLGKPYKKRGHSKCDPEHIHGWDIKPVRFQLTTSDGQHCVSQCYIENQGSWAHYHVGDFVVENPNLSTQIKFSATQIDCTHIKGGLCIDCVLICPSNIGREFNK